MLDQVNTKDVAAPNSADWVHKELAEPKPLPQSDKRALPEESVKQLEIVDPSKGKEGGAKPAAADANKPAESSTEKTSDAGKADGSDKKAPEKIAGRYDNSNIFDAFTEAMDKGLPLVVQVGQSWCPHCRKMETDVLPKIEGGIDKSGKPVPGDLQGKAVFLHIDFDQSKSLTGDVGEVAAKLRDGIKGFPTFRVYNIGKDESVNQTAETVGEMPQATLEDFLAYAGVKK